MNVKSVLRELNGLTASQWGMVTTAQASSRGITRMQLSRLVDEGQLERQGHGVYRDAGTPTDRLDSLKAAWLSINPKLTAEQRILNRQDDAVVSGATASYLLDLGDLLPEPYEFTVPVRRQTQRTELTFRVKKLSAENVTFREGLPVTRPEQTIADLVETRNDRSLIADVLRDVDVIDRQQLAELLAPLAGRNGFKRGDGNSFLDELERLANRDIDSLAKAVASTPLAGKFAEECLKSISAVLPQIGPMLKTQESTHRMGEELAKSPAMKEVIESIKVASENLVRLKPMLEEIGQIAAISQPSVDPRVMRQIADFAASMKPKMELAKAITASPISPRPEGGEW